MKSSVLSYRSLDLLLTAVIVSKSIQEQVKGQTLSDDEVKHPSPPSSPSEDD